MHFSRIASFFAVFMTLSVLVIGKPVAADAVNEVFEVDKRQSGSSIEDILNSLKSQTGSILPQIRTSSTLIVALSPLPPLHMRTDIMGTARECASDERGPHAAPKRSRLIDQSSQVEYQLCPGPRYLGY